MSDDLKIAFIIVTTFLLFVGIITSAMVYSKHMKIENFQRLRP